MEFEDDDTPASEEAPLSTKQVVAEGPFGVATWVLTQQLYDLLPRDKRDRLLDMAGSRRLAPFFSDTCGRLLRQAGRERDVSRLDGTWSLQDRQVTCAFGQVTWQIGEDVWNTLPDDQRETLMQLAELWIHDYFHTIAGNLAAYALREFGS